MHGRLGFMVKNQLTHNHLTPRAESKDKGSYCKSLTNMHYRLYSPTCMIDIPLVCISVVLVKLKYVLVTGLVFLVTELKSWQIIITKNKYCSKT